MIFYFNPSTSCSSLLHMATQYEHIKRTPYFTFYLIFTCIRYSARQVTIITTLSLPPKDDQGAFPVCGNKLIKDIHCDFLQKKIYVLNANYKDDLEMNSHSNLLVIKTWQLSNNISVSDFRTQKSDEILEITRPGQATKDLWGSKHT